MDTVSKAMDTVMKGGTIVYQLILLYTVYVYHVMSKGYVYCYEISV